MKKQEHKIKIKSRLSKQAVDLDDMVEDLEKKGISVNKESLRARSRSRRSIKDIEDG